MQCILFAGFTLVVICVLIGIMENVSIFRRRKPSILIPLCVTTVNDNRKQPPKSCTVSVGLLMMNLSKCLKITLQ